jgi:hypothetical protein
VIDGLDRQKAGMIAMAALEQKPELKRLLSRAVGQETGWRVRCDLLAGDKVLISVRSMSNGATIALAEVPRADVTLDPEGTVRS